MSRVQPQKMNWWYQSIIEWMIENPDLPLKFCARDMGVTQPWLSCIINSDAFRVAYKEARGEHFENTSHHVISKMEGIAMQAADLIAERLEEEGDNIPITQLNSTAELALKALGYGSGPRQQSLSVSVSNEVGVRIAVDREELEAARLRMRNLAVGPRPDTPLVTAGSDPTPALEGPLEEDSERPIKVPAAERV